MINHVFLIGNLGQDPNVKFLESGTAVCNFSVACTESWTKDGEKKESTEWVNIETWDKLAEICGEYLVKGKQVYLEGKIKTEKWDKDGQTHYRTKVVCHVMKMLGGKKSKPDDGYKPPDELPGDDDDIPF